MASVIVDLLLRTGSFETDSDRAAKALDKLGKQAASVSKGIDKQVASLQLQADTFGKSAREATLFELALKGASTSQLKSAESALAQVEAQEKLAAAGNLAVKAVAAIGIAALGAAVAVDQLIQFAGKFQDLSDETGASAVDLASLAVAAGQANVSMESVASATTKLTKNLVGVDDESKAAGAALAALNINISDFKKLDPVSQYEAVSKALAGFADGAQKTAVAQALFGKSGAEQLKVLKALEDQGGRTNILTAQQIALADDFSDRQAKNAATLKLYAAAVATQFIEPTNALIKVAQDAIIQLTGLGNATTALGVNEGVQHFAEGVGRELAKVADYIKTTVNEFKALTGFVEAFGKVSAQLLSGNISGAKQTGADFRAEFNLDANGRKIQAQAGTDAGETFVQAYDKALAGAKRTTFAQTDPRRLDLGKDGRPVDSRTALNFNGAVKPVRGANDDPTKKLLDNQLKALSDAIRQEQDLLGQRNKFLDLYNQQGLVSIKDYYDTQLSILDEATKKESAAYDEQVKLLKANRDAPGRSQKDQADDQGKIEHALKEQAALEQSAGAKALEIGFARQQSTKRQTDEFQSLNAQVLELQGNLSAAAAIKFDQQFEKLKTVFTTEGNANGLKAIQILRDQAISQAEVNKLSQQYSLILGNLSISEDRIAIKQQSTGLGELDALKQTGEARKAAIVQLQAQIDAFDKLDIASKTPEQIQAIERLRLELEKLQATVDPLALKFNSVFEDAFSGAFAEFISGTKTATQAFRDFGKSVLTELTNLASKDIAHSIFGGSGGIGGAISGLFKKDSGTAGAAQPTGLAALFKQDSSKPVLDTTAITASLSTLQTTGSDPAAASLARLADAANSAAQAVPAFTQPVSSGGAPSGEQSITDLFKETNTTTEKATSTTDEYSKSTATATVDVLRLATAASQGSSALSVLPTIVQLFTTAVTAMSATSGSSSSGLGSLFSLFGGSGSSSAAGSSAASTFTTDEALALFFHDGGIVGQTRDTRSVPPGVFNNASRYHEGAIVGAAPTLSLAMNEVPAILMGGPKGTREEVLHASDPRHSDNLTPAIMKAIQGVAGSDGAPGAMAHAQSLIQSHMSESKVSNSHDSIRSDFLNRISDSSHEQIRVRGIHEAFTHHEKTPFDDGGYTGNKGIKEAAGVVHGKEFVFSAKAVKTLGVGYLDHMHELAKAGKVEGYESGGYVGPKSLKPYNAGAVYKEPDGPDSKARRPTQQIQINVSPPAGMTRDSAQQVGANIARQLALASARNN